MSNCCQTTGEYDNEKTEALLDENRTISVIDTATVPDDQCTAVVTLFRVDEVLIGGRAVNAGHQTTERRAPSSVSAANERPVD